VLLCLANKGIPTPAWLRGEIEMPRARIGIDAREMARLDRTEAGARGRGGAGMTAASSTLRRRPDQVEVLGGGHHGGRGVATEIEPVLAEDHGGVVVEFAIDVVVKDAAVMAARAPDQVEADDARTALYRKLEYFPTPPWAARPGPS
jgi:hypothetical protein